MALPDTNAQAMALNQLELLYQTQDLLNSYAIKNMLLTNSAFEQQSVSVHNPNLYLLAATYYGDADLWTAIAQANNLNDPQQSAGFMTLLIPPRPSTSTGGVLNAYPDKSSSNFISSAQS